MLNTPSRFRLYAVPFLLGSTVGIWLYFSLQESNILTSIAGTPITETRISDIHFNITSNNTIELKTSKKINDITSLSLLINFDPERAHIETNDISSTFQKTVASATSNQFVVTIQDIGTLEAEKTLLSILTTGDPVQVSISDVVASFQDWSSASLIIATE